jgi:hypothetical protein
MKASVGVINDENILELQLDEVVITKMRPKPQSQYSSIWGRVIFPPDYKHDVKPTLARMCQSLSSRISLWGGDIRYLNKLGEWKDPVFIVDDWIIYQDFRVISDIPVSDVESIEYVDYEELEFSGLPLPAYGGLFIIYTKSKTWGKGRKIKFNIKAWFPKGYKKAVEFYSPKYETPEELQKGTDRRTTIYWKPDVVFKDGHAAFDFYTGDTKTTCSVVIEGVANNGQLIRYIDKITVEPKSP